MNKLKIEGVPGLDGTYEFEDFDNFTNRELRRIKLLTGLRVGEFDEAFQASDNDFLIGLVVVVLERCGKQVNEDLIWDADAGSFQFDFSGAEDPTQAEAKPLDDDSSRRTSDEPSSSGTASSEPSDHQGNGLSRIGAQDSLSSAISDPQTLAS